jgi:hypothetical protein
VSVTGRVYSATRVRGLADWSPRTATRALLVHIATVVDEFADYLPITLRQVFYRLVATSDYPKDEWASERLGETLNRARRAGLLDWGAIRDDGATRVDPEGFNGTPHFLATIQALAEAYTRDPAPDQEVDVEVWVEAAGMVPQVARVAGPYGVPVFSGGGFDSVTAKHDAALRIVERSRRSRRTVVLQIGDHDASGCSIVDSAAADVSKFCADYSEPDSVAFRRIAVTPDQVETLRLPTAPPKPKDRRGERMAYTVQAEAIAPPILADIVRLAIEAELDLDILDRSRREGEAERRRLIRALATLPEEP